MEQFQVLVDKNLYQRNFKYFKVILAHVLDEPREKSSGV